MRYAIVKAGVCVDVVEADQAGAQIAAQFYGGQAVESAVASPRDSYAGGVFTRSTARSVPREVTMRQAREALIDAGLIDAVEAAINALPDGAAKAKARNAWEKSQTVQRHFGLVAQLAPVLGLTSQQLDDLFIQASHL